ncbi:MAG: AraC family transcriptional regulator [Bacteroidetes bacterium 41-46]|nr:MAG: AraC family transcriptional regulator [Bacteroidetes bacterium 41-46]
MKYIFLIAAFNALFFALLIFQKKKALHDKVLILWLIYLGIYTGIYALFSETMFDNFHILSASFISLLLLHGPFLFLYISSLADINFKMNQTKLIHFAPFVLFNLFLLIASQYPEISEGIRLNHTHGMHKPVWVFNLFLISVVLSGPFYFILSILSLKRLDVNIFNNFSTLENVNLSWLRKLIYTFGFIWTALMIFAMIHHVFNMFSWIFCTHGLTLSLSVFIIIIGYLGLKQKEIFVNFPDSGSEFVTEERAKYSGVAADEEETKHYVSNLRQYMDAEKPYLDPEISLPELSKRLGVSSHFLSRVINEQLGVNFFDFVNRYRVEEVKLRITDPKFNYLSILGIAFESGFNTKSTFNRVFKKTTGLTPKEFREQSEN